MDPDEDRDGESRRARILGSGLLCCVLTVVTAQYLAGLSVFWYRAQLAVPALCQEGRVAHAGQHSNSTVSIHVRVGSPAELECLLPVAVYDLRLIHEPRENLRQVGLQGPTTVPFEQVSSGVKCMQANASIFDHFNNVASLQFYKNCQDHKWDCKHGQCSPYEKALRVCLSKLTPESYECTYVPGKPTLGVTKTGKQIVQVSLTCLAFAVIVALSVAFVAFDYDAGGFTAPSFKFQTESAYWGIAMLAFGALFAYIDFVQMTRTPLRFDRAADLSTCTTGEFHMCAPPSPEEAPWNRFISPTVYYLLHGILMIPLLISLMLCFTGVMARHRQGPDEHTPLV